MGPISVCHLGGDIAEMSTYNPRVSGDRPLTLLSIDHSQRLEQLLLPLGKSFWKAVGKRLKTQRKRSDGIMWGGTMDFQLELKVIHQPLA